MQELDCYLNLGQQRMGLKELEKENWNVLCVVLNVRVWCSVVGVFGL